MRRLLTVSMALATFSVAACNKSDAGPHAQTSATAPGSGPVKNTSASPGNKAALGEPAPDFQLTGLDGAKAKLSDHKGKVVVLEWFNPDCPFVRNAHSVGSLKGMAKAMKDKYDGELVWLAINSNAAGTQGNGDETNRAGKEKLGIDYPILYDPDGSVGKAYGATNTPHMYVIDKEGKLVYQGALDNTGSGEPDDAEPELINYVSDALEDVNAGRSVRNSETKAWGCSVKYQS